MGLEFFNDDGQLVILQDSDVDDVMLPIIKPRTAELLPLKPNEKRQAITSVDLQPNPPGSGGVVKSKTTEGVVTNGDLIIKREVIETVHLAAGETAFVLGRAFKGN